MELATAEQRREFVDKMISDAFKFMDDADNEDPDEDNDWGGAEVVTDDLTAAEKMIEAEQIFLDTLSKLERVPKRCESAKCALLFKDALDEFVQNILLGRLNHAAKILDEWNFRTERGIKFKDALYKKIDTLIEVYQQCYDEDD